jgi:hypothetical protein
MTAGEWISSPSGKGTFWLLAAVALLLVVPAEWIRWAVSIRVLFFAVGELKEACDRLPAGSEGPSTTVLCRVMDDGQGEEVIAPEERYPSSMVRQNLVGSEDLDLESDD